MADRSFRLLLFDFDGTLVDSQRIIVAAMSEAFAGERLAAPEAALVKRVVGLTLEMAVARLLPPDSESALAARLACRYRQAFFRLRQDPAYHEPLYPGAAETLLVLDRPPARLGIATGKSRRGLMAVLERHALASHFVTLQTADDNPSKPDPTMVRRAMADAGVEAAETAVIGDTVYDMEMARSAGAVALGVAWGYHDPAELLAAGAAAIVPRFETLPAALASVRGKAA